MNFIRSIVISSSVLFFTMTASAHTYHTANVCSTTAASICAHAGYSKIPNITDPSEFMLHFLSPAASPADLTKLTNIKVQLWMPNMGHGSSPVTVTATTKADHYSITDAYFIMAGAWEIQVTFDYDGATHALAIPIDVP